jgi:hypothetical protein
VDDPIVDEIRHLNSLGFVIGSKQSRALIAWGYDSTGARISIGDAKRGGDQGLRCECRALLIAKKGEIREHHFAHKAGDIRYCDVAASAAVRTFIADTLLDAGAIAIPVTGGLSSQAQVLAVSTQMIAGKSVQLVDAQRGRTLAVYARLRRESTDAITDWCKAQDVSGMVIDLTQFRNRTDDEISSAIRSTALRKWLWRSDRNDHQAKPRIVRRIYGLRG